MNSALNVLIVDDSSADRALLLRALRREFPDCRAREAGRADDFARALQQDGFDLVITDYHLGWTDGLAVLSGAKSRWPDCPVIMATATGNEEIAVESMKAGLSDYVLKSPKHLMRLPAAARAAIERARQRRALEEAETRYRDLVENSHELICSHDLEGRILFANRATARLTGYAEPALLTMNLRDLLVPEYRADFDRYVETVRRDGAASGLMAVLTATGDRRVLEYDNTLRTEGVAVPTVRAIARDVTGRLRAERERDRLLAREQAARAEAEARQQEVEALLEATKQINASLDIAVTLGSILDNVVRLSESEIAMFALLDETGTKLNYAASRGPMAHLVQDAWIPIGEGMVGLAAQTGEVVDSPNLDDDPRRLYRFVRKDAGMGSALYIPLRSGERVFGVLSAYGKDQCHFTPARRRLLLGLADQAALAIARAREVAERARVEEQLRQSQKMEAIGRLAGGIAHDFNNLLTVVTGFCELLLNSMTDSDPHRGAIEEIAKAGDRAATLTRQILAFSRRQVVEAKEIDLGTVVASMETMLRRVIGEDVELITSVDPGLGLVKADPGQIEQVLMNLAVNARDAMPQGGHLTIELANVELDEAYARTHAGVQPGPYVLMAVSDTGVGMDAATQARIFEPFFTTKAPGEGTGLGLATVYGIVQQSNGHVWVYSEPGRGTTFKVYLPPLGRVGTASEAVAKNTPLSSGSGTILLVEDEAQIRGLIRQALEGAGYRVLEADRGESALALAERHAGPIDLLLTDVVMPGVGGRQVAERVTALRTGAKVLYMSGYTDDAVVRHGTLAAGSAFIQKPFTLVALAQKVRDVLAAGQTP